MSRLALAVEKQAARPAGTAETAIARLAQADRALAEAIEVADAVNLVGTAKALREWASAVHAGKDHERQAAVFVLRAIRNAGERIAAAQARGEVATQHTGRGDVSPTATLSELGVTRDESSEWKRLAAQYPTDEELAAAAEALPVPSLAGALRIGPMLQNASDEWYTPEHIVRAAIACLGSIDLDPCSNPGSPNVPASSRFTAEDDGLAQGWRGTVYMNPPYSQSAAWAQKLADEYAYGNVTAAVALVAARVDTAWFRTLEMADLCFLNGRLRFLQPTGERAANSAPFPSMVAYLGPDFDRFARAFSGLGVLYRRVEAAA